MADSEQDADGEEAAEVTLQDLKQRIDTLEDRVMMERLEDLGIEDEIEVVEDLLERDAETVREKLEMLERIEEKYEETQVEEKLQYLYQQLQSVKETVENLESGQVQENEVSELRGRIDRLETQVEQSGTGDEDQNFDDVYDKLYTLRDRMEELSDQIEEVEAGGGGEGSVDIDTIVRRVESRVGDFETGGGGGGPSVDEVKRRVLEDMDVSATGASAREIKEQVLAQIDPGDISDAALDDLRDEIDKLRGRIEAHQEISGGGDGGASDELRSRVAELEGQVEELEHRDFGSSESGEGATVAPEEIEGLQDDLDALRDEVAEAAKQDLEEEIGSLRDDVDALKEEAGGESASPEKLAALEEKVEELDDRLPSDELLESVEYVDEEFRGELAEVRERVEHVQDSLQEEVEGLREELEPLQERVSAIEGEDLDAVEERVSELDSRADDIEERLELDARELLEALEYEGEELEDRFKDILVQIERLREEIGKQGERIDSLSHAQNIFESNIGSVMQEQRDLVEQLQQEDQKLDRKTDFLLEALEEGLALEEESFHQDIKEIESQTTARRESLRTVLADRMDQLEAEIDAEEIEIDTRTDLLLEAIEEVAAETDHRFETRDADRLAEHEELRQQLEEVQAEIEGQSLATDESVDMLLQVVEEGLERQQDEMEAMAEEQGLRIPEDVERELSAATGETGVNALARMAMENQERVEELRQKIEDMEKHAPTVIE